MAAHFPVNEVLPDYVLIQADHDLRNTRDLAAARAGRRPSAATVPGRRLGPRRHPACGHADHRRPRWATRPARVGRPPARRPNGRGAAPARRGAAPLGDGAEASSTTVPDSWRTAPSRRSWVPDGSSTGRPPRIEPWLRLADGSSETADGSRRLRDGAAQLASGLATGYDQAKIAVDDLALAGRRPRPEPDLRAPWTRTVARPATASARSTAPSGTDCCQVYEKRRMRPASSETAAAPWAVP